MKNQIIFADGTTFDLAVTAEAPVKPFPKGRQWKQMHVVGTVDEVKAAFVDNAEYRHEWESLVETEDGSTTTEIVTDDLTAYSIAGDITDMRDGTVYVYMGKPTETELMQAQLDAAEAAMKEGVNSIDE